MISKYKPGYEAKHRADRPDIRTTEDDQAGDGTVEGAGDSTDDEVGDAAGSGSPPELDEDSPEPPDDQ